MDGLSKIAEYANLPEAGASSTRLGFEPTRTNCSGEELRDVIGRNVMTWIGAGTAQPCEPESVLLMTEAD